PGAARSPRRRAGGGTRPLEPRAQRCEPPRGTRDPGDRGGPRRGQPDPAPRRSSRPHGAGHPSRRPVAPYPAGVAASHDPGRGRCPSCGGSHGHRGHREGSGRPGHPYSPPDRRRAGADRDRRGRSSDGPVELPSADRHPRALRPAEPHLMRRPSIGLLVTLAPACRAAPLPDSQRFPAGTQFTARLLRIEGTRIRYIDAGQGLAVVVGHPLGGATAAEVAIAAPKRVRALVLLGAAGFGTREPALFRVARWPIVGPVMLAFRNRSLVERLLKSTYADPRKVREADV